MATWTADFPQGSGGSLGKLYFQIDVVVESQDVNSNSSVVAWSAYAVQRDVSYSWCGYHDATAQIYINSTLVFDGKWNGTGDWDFRNLGAWATQPIATGKVTVYHDADGSKTIAIHASATDVSFPLGTAATGWVAMALPTIPRASGFTLSRSSVPCDGVSTVGVTISPAAPQFVHDVYWWIDGPAFNGWSGGLNRQGVGTSTTSPPIPKTWARQVPNSSSGTINVLVVTRNGGTEVGRVQKTMTMTVPTTAEFQPTLTTSSARLQHGALSGLTVVLQGYSGYRFQITGAAGAYDSRPASYSITGPEGTRSGQWVSGTKTLDIQPLRKAGSQVYTLAVTDSRGRKASKTITINVTAYQQPGISNPSASRALSNGALNDDGTYAKVSATFTRTPFTGQSFLARAWYRAVGATTWLGETSFGTNPGALSAVVGANALTPAVPWEIRIVAQDYLASTEVILTLPPARYIQSVDTVNNSVAFGGPALATPEFRVYESMPVKIMGNAFHLGKGFERMYGSGEVFYGPANGLLIKTNIKLTDSIMWTLDVRVNSYSPTDPGGMAWLQGYAYAGGSAIINYSGLTTLSALTVEAFFIGDFMHFWLPYQGYARTYFINIGCSDGSGNERITNMTDSALPSSRARAVSILCDPLTTGAAATAKLAANQSTSPGVWSIAALTNVGNLNTRLSYNASQKAFTSSGTVNLIPGWYHVDATVQFDTGSATLGGLVEAKITSGDFVLAQHSSLATTWWAASLSGTAYITSPPRLQTKHGSAGAVPLIANITRMGMSKVA